MSIRNGYAVCQGAVLTGYPENCKPMRQQAYCSAHRCRSVGFYTGFIFPHMAPDEIDRFISWQIQKGYDPYQVSQANDRFKRMVYNQYAKRYNKKRV